MSTFGGNDYLIQLDPVKAQGMLDAVTNQQVSFIAALDAFAAALKRLDAASLNNQVNAAAILGNHLRNALTYLVGVTFSDYFNNANSVFEDWRQSDFKAAAPTKYTPPPVDFPEIGSKTSINTKVSLNLMRETITELKTQLGIMLECYEAIDKLVNDSVQFWKGETGVKSRSTWTSKIYAKKADLVREANYFIELLTGVKDDLTFRDSGGGNVGTDEIEWDPPICENTFGELSGQWQNLKRVVWDMGSPPCGWEIIGLVGATGLYSAVLGAVEHSVGGLDRFLGIQEAYRDRIKAPYEALGEADLGQAPETAALLTPHTLGPVNIASVGRWNSNSLITNPDDPAAPAPFTMLPTSETKTTAGIPDWILPGYNYAGDYTATSYLNQFLGNNPGLTPVYNPNMSIESLTQATANGPAIVSVKNSIFADGRHALVVDSIENGMVAVRDPSGGVAHKVSLETFLQVWNGKGVILK